MAAIQGLVAAGTVAYLTRDPTWEKTGLGINYLFYLIGNAGRVAHVQIPFLAISSKAVFVLTPFVLPFLIGASQQEPRDESRYEYRHNQEMMSSEFKGVRPSNAGVKKNLSRFVYVAAAASALVLVAFGHLAYGAAFFSIAALDFLTRNEKVDKTVRKFFTGLAGIPAVLSFWSYGLNLSTTPGVQLMVLVAFQVLGLRIYQFLNGGGYSGGGYRYGHHYSFSSSRSEVESAPATEPSTEKKFPEIGNLMGPLPHGL